MCVTHKENTKSNKGDDVAKQYSVTYKFTYRNIKKVRKCSIRKTSDDMNL